jgi:methylmalonyl-CoA mutase N-terminal domain/subunit
MDIDSKFTDSGIEIKKWYGAGSQQEAAPELPGEFPFTRGIQTDMYRGKLWTMHQCIGYGSAEESNKAFHRLLEQGVTGLSTGFDLPTQKGYDSDHVKADGEVGKRGVAIDSLDDMETLFKGIHLQDISTSLAVNATGFILLAFYVALAKRQGADLHQIAGTLQNDILNEYATRGNYIYPPGASMRIITDIFEWCGTELPKWNVISISGYHIREAGSTAVQELAFTLSNGKAYVRAALASGLDINVFGKRLSFFFSAHNNLFEEVAKFRAARRMWAKIMKAFGATDEKAMMLRFHTQTAGGTLTARQPVDNISRETIQALSAVLGGTQSLHTNGYGKVLELLAEEAARLALCSQQILAFESGVADTTDPLAGSYFVEALTDEVELKASQLIAAIDAIGGSVMAIEKGFMQNEISSTIEYRRQVENGGKIVVGGNKHESPGIDGAPGPEINNAIRQLQSEKLQALRRNRDPARCDSILQGLNDRAAGDENIMPAVMEAVENKCTLGEIADTLREVYGENK